MLDVGDLAPDAAFDTADGKRARISDWRGRMLVVYFYPKDDTSGCTREAMDFSALNTQFENAGATIVGISRDSVKSHVRFADKHALTIMLGSDGDGGMCEAFGVWVEKSLYGRKYMGIERATFLIDADGRIAETWRKVKVADHADSVLASVRRRA